MHWELKILSPVTPEGRIQISLHERICSPAIFDHVFMYTQSYKRGNDLKKSSKIGIFHNFW